MSPTIQYYQALYLYRSRRVTPTNKGGFDVPQETRMVAAGTPINQGRHGAGKVVEMPRTGDRINREFADAEGNPAAAATQVQEIQEALVWINDLAVIAHQPAAGEDPQPEEDPLPVEDPQPEEDPQLEVDPPPDPHPEREPTGATQGDPPQVLNPMIEVPVMARTVVSYERPKSFIGYAGQNPTVWMERFEIVAEQNRGQDADKVANFPLYLEGAAENWYKTTNPPNNWLDLPEAAGPPVVPAMVGLKNTFLDVFKPAEYRSLQEEKLKNSYQDATDPLFSYCFDIMDLCKKMDPNMDERTKVKYYIPH